MDLQKLKPNTFVPLNSLRLLTQLTSFVIKQDTPGVIVECGVYKGGSAAAIASVRENRPMFLFDSFQGMPETSEKDGDLAKSKVGLGTANVSDVVDLFDKMELSLENVSIIEGWFEETLEKPQIQEIALLHIDCDWYESVSYVLRTLYDKVSEGGIIILDDFGHWEGARVAFFDFCRSKGIAPLVERYGHTQLYWVKGRENNRDQFGHPAEPIVNI